MTNKLNRKVLDKRDTRETHTSRVWREELAEILEVNLRHREALKRGSIWPYEFIKPPEAAVQLPPYSPHSETLRLSLSGMGGGRPKSL